MSRLDDENRARMGELSVFIRKEYEIKTVTDYLNVLAETARQQGVDLPLVIAWLQDPAGLGHLGILELSQEQLESVANGWNLEDLYQVKLAEIESTMGPVEYLTDGVLAPIFRRIAGEMRVLMDEQIYTEQEMLITLLNLVNIMKGRIDNPAQPVLEGFYQGDHFPRMELIRSLLRDGVFPPTEN